MISTTVRRQLVAFAVVTVVALTTMAVHYLRLPAQAGVGTYTVGVHLPETAGLYAGAPVTYRGVTVGEVADVSLAPGGVEARLVMEDAAEVPAAARVAVRNGSVIGEPYVDFQPSGAGSGSTLLADGATVPASRVTLPVPTSRLLDSTEAMLRSVPRRDLRTTVDQAYTALEGNSGTLRGLLDSGTSLTAAARANQESTLSLIDRAEPVLRTQRDLAADTAASTRNLERVTATLAARDDVLRGVLDTAPETRRTAHFLHALQGDLPALLHGGSQLTEVLDVYVPAIQHMLIVMPALVEANQSVQTYYPDQDYGEAGLSFKMSVNNPPVCTQGFPEAYHQRPPSDVSPRPLPRDSYCKVAPADPRVVRGTRNFPCPQDPARRGATAAKCGLVFNEDELD